MHTKEVSGILSASCGINVYRGCTHGCIYCDARSRCYAMTHEFEDVEIKINAPEVLDDALRRKRKPCMVGTGSMSDPYNHYEEEFKITRKCLEVIEQNGCGVALQTKSSRILRDLDILKQINEKTKCVVEMTLTTFDEELCRIIEPNVSSTKERFDTLEIMRDNGIPTVVWFDPVLPFINDTEENLRGIMDYCIRARVKGIICGGMGVTLREGDREYFYEALDRSFPKMKERYIKTYANDYEVMSPNNGALMKIFRSLCKENGIMSDMYEVFSYMREFEDKMSEAQTSLF